MSEFPVFSTVSFTIVIILYIFFLGLTILCNCSFVHFNQHISVYPISVQFSLSVMSDSLQPHGLQHARLPCSSLTPGACSDCFFFFFPIESVMPSICLILCCPLLFLPSIFLSYRVFSNEYSGLISFWIDWLDLLAVQGTFSRVFSNTTVQKHQFFSDQLSL